MTGRQDYKTGKDMNFFTIKVENSCPFLFLSKLQAFYLRNPCFFNVAFNDSDIISLSAFL